ncbi:hypothetical protein [Rathayibacter rathayi]|uniref:hypothetical protein n=1 Tax=Rathayibacter rathayi TaxID=33887 RepID=UPI000CE935D0|nr:hypothetical protein [Rathayibacter rathayi]PPF51980.1 hypothetical protein C5C08_01095 [Rathayibacter rathayi]PPF83587.1 hypothetical protein C5C14_01095 [Rathayibacter rathayi]PPG16146.1 hypothetical protein C5C11_00350 [Rathayibacter rathayi]PPG47406.1 hypothetical protein C5C20_01100 [Rathayibacter rathayi]PPI04971.1 hypothetical protein C5C43_01100 [Rathayibacter rathayi]
MTTFTNSQLHEIRHSARVIAEEEIANRGIEDPDTIDYLAEWLYIMRDRWASFNEDSDSDSYLPLVESYFSID